MKYPSPDELEVIYAQREKRLEQLSKVPVITSEHLADLDRLGRCQLANKLWSRCGEMVRKQLLNDAHPHVRCCAIIAQQQMQA